MNKQTSFRPMTFDDKAKDWDSNPGFVERAHIIASAIKTAIQAPKCMNALELGCGTGLLSYFLKDDFGQIVLTDTSKGMLEVLAQKIERESIPNFHPLLLDLSSADYPDPNHKFDAVYSSMVFHHIADIDQVMKRLYQITNKDAYICIADLDKEDGSFHAHDPLFDGRNGFEKEEIEQFLTRNGFKIISYQICHEMEKQRPDGTTARYSIFLIVGQKNG